MGLSDRPGARGGRHLDDGVRRAGDAGAAASRRTTDQPVPRGQTRHSFRRPDRIPRRARRGRAGPAGDPRAAAMGGLPRRLRRAARGPRRSAPSGRGRRRRAPHGRGRRLPFRTAAPRERTPRPRARGRCPSGRHHRRRGRADLGDTLRRTGLGGGGAGARGAVQDDPEGPSPCRAAPGPLPHRTGRRHLQRRTDRQPARPPRHTPPPRLTPITHPPPAATQRDTSEPGTGEEARAPGAFTRPGIRSQSTRDPIDGAPAPPSAARPRPPHGAHSGGPSCD